MSLRVFIFRIFYHGRYWNRYARSHIEHIQTASERGSRDLEAHVS